MSCSRVIFFSPSNRRKDSNVGGAFMIATLAPEKCLEIGAGPRRPRAEEQQRWGKLVWLGHCDRSHNITQHHTCAVCVYLVMVQHTPGPLPAEGYLQQG